MNKAKLLCVTAIVLALMTAFSVSVTALAYSGYSQNVTIRFQRNGAPMSGAVAEVYQLEDSWPARLVGNLQSGYAGSAAISLPTGEYCVEAYVRGESGYHGYTTFAVDTNSGYTNGKLVSVEMRPNEDKSMSVDLTPNMATMKPDKQDVTMVSAISGVQGKEGKDEVPVNIDNQVLSNKDKLTPVNLAQLDPATRAILTNLEQKIKAQNPSSGGALISSPAPGSIGTQSVGDKIWLNLIAYALVTEEYHYILWHAIAVIDSVQGLTHSFALSAYSGDSVQLSASIACAGISVGGSYSTSNTLQISFEPTTVANGQVVSYRCQFQHTYQSGPVYVYWFPFGWFYAGSFQREYIDTWYPASKSTPNGADYSPTRANYLGEWQGAATCDITMSSSTSWSGSIGASVDRTDVFGASASISLTYTYTYGTQAAHHLVWNPPASNCYLDIYSGNAFDINVLSYYYYSGGGGGCPFLIVYDGSQYVNEGLLNIHGNSDVVCTHVLTTTPAVVNGMFVLQLTEHWKTISHVDQVKLYATLQNGETIQLPLVSATHSKLGNVLPQLLFDDGWRVDELGAKWNNGTSQSIDLRFLVLPPSLHVVSFTFFIDGYNVIVK